MIVELGNANPIENVDDEVKTLAGPAVTTFTINPAPVEDGFLPGYKTGTIVNDILRIFAQYPGPMKPGMGGNEILVDIIGSWNRHSSSVPTWVNVKDPTPFPTDVAEDLERFIAEYFNIPRGAPEDLEGSHYTQYGSTLYAPGEAPESEGDTNG